MVLEKEVSAWSLNESMCINMNSFLDECTGLAHVQFEFMVVPVRIKECGV